MEDDKAEALDVLQAIVVATEFGVVYVVGGSTLGIGLQILLNLPWGPQASQPGEVHLVPFFLAGTLQVPVATMAMARQSRSLLAASLTGPLAVVIAFAILHPASLGFAPGAAEWVERRSLLCLIAGSCLLVVYAFERMAGRITFPGQSRLLRRAEKLVDQDDRVSDQRRQ